MLGSLLQSVRGTWMGPQEITLREERLCYRPESMQRFIRAKPTLLEEFIGLADADSSAIAKFVEHWGVLGLCRHNLPLGHPVLSEYLSISGWKAPSRFCEVVPHASIDQE